MEKFIHEQRRSGLSYEAELELLAEVYRLALESFRKRKNEEGGSAPAPEDAMKGTKDDRATTDYMG